MAGPGQAKKKYARVSGATNFIIPALFLVGVALVHRAGAFSLVDSKSEVVVEESARVLMNRTYGRE